MILSEKLNSDDNSKSSFLVFLFSIWILISSLYYLNELLLGDIGPDRVQNSFFAAFKYILILFFSLWLSCIYKKMFFGLFSSFCFFAVILLYVASVKIVVGSSVELTYTFNSLFVFFSMFGLTGLFGCLNKDAIERLDFAFIISGVLVSAFCFVQLFLLESLFLTHWERTGGVRLVSTLLNPNNLGAYMGFCLILLVSSRLSLAVKTPIFFLFIFSFVMSGSRSSWVALVFVAVLFAIYNLKLKFNVGRFFKLFICFSFFVTVFVSGIFYLDLSVINFSRFQDAASASSRLEMYFDYLYNFDFEYFFPDLSSSRYHLVNESSYFMLMNSLGVLGSILLFLIFFSFYKFGYFYSAWNFVLFYYLILGCFGNLLNSFPNNQVFFISLGSFFMFRRDLFCAK